MNEPTGSKIDRPDEEWKKELPPETFTVMRKHGTERAGTSPLNKEHRPGRYACASCGLTFKKEYPKLLRPGAKTPVVLDIHDFLSSRIAGIKLNPVNKSITVHDPCHLGRGQGLSRTVRDLLKPIPGLSLVEMKDSDRCCGFGGVMRITHRSLSDGIAVDKINNIIATRAAVVATGCPGCCMQIADALRRHESDIGVVHPVQLLEEALTGLK